MSRAGGLVALLCAACVQSGEVMCEDGRLCAPGYFCDDENDRCISPDQVNACAGLDEGAACTFSGAPGSCRMGACEPLVCGDGLRSLGEACDASDLGGADCTTAGFYNPDGLACTSFCTFDVTACTGSCGDNMINGDELCDGTAPAGTCFDLGFDAGALACAQSCGFSFASCGRFGWPGEPIGIPFAYGFAGTSESDLWTVGEDASGNGVIAHSDGSGWTREMRSSTDKLLAVWAVTPTDAWIASAGAGIGQPGRPLRWNGTQWATDAAAPLADYSDVWAAGSNAVYFATLDAGVQWFDGSTWQALGALSGPVVAIHGAGAGDVWAAKADGTLHHWTGTLWQPVAVNVRVRHLDVLAADSVWVIGSSTTATAAAVAHWNGSSWTTYTDASVSSEAFTAVVAIAANDVWVAGPAGQVRHFDGIRWIDAAIRVTTDVTAGVAHLRKLGDLVFGAASNGFVHRYRGQMFGKLNPNDPNTTLTLWSSGPNDLFVGDLRGNVNRYNGQTWTLHPVDTAMASITALFGSGPSDVWGVSGGSSGRVQRWNGSMWSLQTSLASAVNAIWASGPTDVWFFGAGVHRYDGSMFTPVATGASSYQAASGSGPGDIWALAPSGAGTTTIARYNGATWSLTTMPHDMTAIVVLAPNNVFVTADNNHILHFDGTGWTDTIAPVSTRLVQIAASAPDDVIAVSQSEAVHFDGTTWTPLRVPMEGFATVRAVTAAAGYIDLLYGGAGGNVVRRLIRTRPWNCRATETCSNGVDDDCDGNADALDTECP
ncbi:MAG TPA: hypothetical protein VIV11_42790 [Kofleriaceae bacterium]